MGLGVGCQAEGGGGGTISSLRGDPSPLQVVISRGWGCLWAHARHHGGLGKESLAAWWGALVQWAALPMPLGWGWLGGDALAARGPKAGSVLGGEA